MNFFTTETAGLSSDALRLRVAAGVVGVSGPFPGIGGGTWHMPSGSVIGSNCGLSDGGTHRDSPVSLFQKYGLFSLLLQNFFHPCCWSSGDNSDSAKTPGT